MAEIIGKTTGYSPLNNYNQYSSCKKMKKLSPAFSGLTAASLAVRSSATFGRRMVVEGQQRCFKTQPAAAAASDHVMMCFGNGKCLKWWEKDLKPNMKEMAGAADLVDSLLTAGDKLVVVNFFSPGCGGCKALHPKICQLAEMNPEIQFLQVNHEEHISMCYSLNVRVLPFFRFYRGAHGCLCSFSCTNATIKKFKDALAKHIPDRCSLGPPKGLGEKELLALGSNMDLSFTYPPKPNSNPNRIAKDNTCTYRSRL